MLVNGILRLNGKNLSDKHSPFTFRGEQGHSVIDLLWANFSGTKLIKDMGVNQLSHIVKERIDSECLAANKRSHVYANKLSKNFFLKS